MSAGERLTEALVGTWRLQSFEVRSDDGTVTRPFGEEVFGALIYTAEAAVSAQVMRGDRPYVAAGDPQACTPDEAFASFRGCVSYYGAFETDPEGGYVVHHIRRSLFRNWEGQAHKRFVRLDGEQLTLSTPPTLFGGTSIVGVLQWQKVSNRLECIIAASQESS